MFKISKKIALLLSFGTIFAPTSADSFLSKLVKDYPYAIPYCCVAMGLFSFAQGMRAEHFQRIDEMRERSKKQDLNDFIHDENIEEIEKISKSQSSFFLEERLRDLKKGITSTKRDTLQAVKPIEFDVEHYVNNLTPKDYIIHSTKKMNHRLFPNKEILVHQVTHWQLPPLMQKETKTNEWKRSHSTLYQSIPDNNQAISDKKIEKSWLPAFYFGVSALNFATAIGFATCGYTKKA